MGDQAILIPRLVLITDFSRFSSTDAGLRTIDQALVGGVDAVLLRERIESPRLLGLAAELRTLTRKFNASLIIHSRADIATAVDADGLHVAARDISRIPLIRRQLGHYGITQARISASCHNAEELAEATHAGADFVLLSPVFPTLSHPGHPALGVEEFKRLAAGCRLPVIALGGITAENRSHLRGYGVAVIRAILAAADPTKAAGQLLDS